MDCNPSGSSVHGISQARILERVAAESLREALIAKGPGLIPDQRGKIPLASVSWSKKKKKAATLIYLHPSMLSPAPRFVI